MKIETTIDSLKLAKPMLMDYIAICHQLPDDQRHQWAALNGEPYDPETVALEVASRAGPRWVLVDQCGVPVMLGGFQMLAPGVWQDWLLSTELAWTRYPKAATRVCRQQINLMLETEAHRVQATCLASRQRVRDWYRLVGYQYEGRLRRAAANGEDVVIYARVRE